MKKRRDKFEITKEIYSLLKNNKEMSVRQISKSVYSRWDLALKCLLFLKDLNLIKETRGKTTYKTERLFSLN
ncbi:MAG: hypothetical protein IH845_05840 [Nanoarchaeota archaeon]|nr:hypothetical protein [Nanoarchaeota archaeon]